MNSKCARFKPCGAERRELVFAFNRCEHLGTKAFGLWILTWINMAASATVQFMSLRAFWFLPLLLILLESAGGADTSKRKPLTMADVLAASQAADWEALDPENTLYLE